MEKFTARQIFILIAALLVSGGLTAWGTVYVLRTFVLADPNDPLIRQGGLSPAQLIKK
jgi:hypothetical protein